MAINPNIDFSSGSVFTADQANRFPRGVMAYSQHTSNVGFSTETTILTTSFTAVANRYYRLTFFEPGLSNLNIGLSLLRIKSGATILTQGNVANPVANTLYAGSLVLVSSFTAGAKTITATAQSSSTGVANASASQIGFLVIEDIGPA